MDRMVSEILTELDDPVTLKLLRYGGDSQEEIEKAIQAFREGNPKSLLEVLGHAHCEAQNIPDIADAQGKAVEPSDNEFLTNIGRLRHLVKESVKVHP